MGDVHCMNPDVDSSGEPCSSVALVGDRHPDVILVNSPSRLYENSTKLSGERELTPYGLGSVATATQKALGAKVGVLDTEQMGLATEEIMDLLLGNMSSPEARVFGFNIMTPSFVPTIRIAKTLVSRVPNATIVFGGPHATLDPISILKHIPTAIVISGEGEVAFSKIVDGQPLENIHGLIYLKDGKPVQVGVANMIHDLSSLPWVNRQFFANEPYQKAGRRTMTFLSSRGCAARCSFCITPAQFEVMKESGGKRVRFRDLDDVVAEVASLKPFYDLELAQFIDDVMLPNKRRVREFLAAWEKYRLCGNTEFTCLLRPDTIKRFADHGLLKELYDAGLRRLTLGIETGHDRGRVMMSGYRGRIDPKYSETNILAAVRSCNRLGIRTKGFFMLGLPGETKEEIEQTLHLMSRLGDEGLQRVAIFPVKVYPHTGLWAEALNMGLTPDDLGHYAAPRVKELIKNGYSAKESTRDGFTQKIQLCEIPPEQLNELCQLHMKSFNRRAKKRRMASTPENRNQGRKRHET